MLGLIDLRDEKSFELALFHGFVMPIIIACWSYIIDSHFTLVSVLSYVVFVSLLHLYRVSTTNNKIYQERAYSFLRVIGGIAITFIVALIVLFILIYG